MQFLLIGKDRQTKKKFGGSTYHSKTFFFTNVVRQVLPKKVVCFRKKEKNIFVVFLW